MLEPAEIIEFEHGIVGKVMWDEYCEADMYDPRQWENIGTMITAHRNYVLGDEQVNRVDSEGHLLAIIAESAGVDLLCNVCNRKVDSDDYESWFHYDDEWESEDDYLCEGVEIQPTYDEDLVIMPLFLMDHSGISISTSDTMFRMADSHGWDWGQVGVIYVTRKKMENEFLLHENDNELSWQPRAREILKAEVETYDLYLTGQCYGYVIEDHKGRVLDSCWGFLGDKDVVLEMKSAAEYHVNELAAELAAANLPIVNNL